MFDNYTLEQFSTFVKERFNYTVRFPEELKDPFQTIIRTTVLRNRSIRVIIERGVQTDTVLLDITRNLLLDIFEHMLTPSYIKKDLVDFNLTVEEVYRQSSYCPFVCINTEENLTYNMVKSLDIPFFERHALRCWLRTEIDKILNDITLHHSFELPTLDLEKKKEFNSKMENKDSCNRITDLEGRKKSPLRKKSADKKQDKKKS